MYYTTKSRNKDYTRRVRREANKHSVSPKRKKMLKKNRSKKLRRASKDSVVFKTPPPPQRKRVCPPAPKKKSRTNSNDFGIRDIIRGGMQMATHILEANAPAPKKKSRADSIDFLKWARNLPFHSALKHRLATDIQMAWRRMKTQSRVQTNKKAMDALLHNRSCLNMYMRSTLTMTQFLNNDYSILVNCSKLFPQVEFLYIRLIELNNLNKNFEPRNELLKEEWLHIAATINRASQLLVSVIDRLIELEGIKSSEHKLLQKAIKNFPNGISYSDVKDIIKQESWTSSRDVEEAAWNNIGC